MPVHDFLRPLILALTPNYSKTNDKELQPDYCLAIRNAVRIIESPQHVCDCDIWREIVFCYKATIRMSYARNQSRLTMLSNVPGPNERLSSSIRDPRLRVAVALRSAEDWQSLHSGDTTHLTVANTRQPESQE